MTRIKAQAVQPTLRSRSIEVREIKNRQLTSLLFARAFMSSSVHFPSPIGGVPFEQDFAPSIVFLVAYAVISIRAFYRLFRSESRTMAVAATVISAVERIVTYSLRARQAKSPSEDLSHGLTRYWQLTYAIGYISMYSDLVGCMHCLFVKTTMGSTATSRTALVASPTDEYSTSNLAGDSIPVEDQPKRRALYRRIFLVAKLFYVLPLIFGIVAGVEYIPGETNTGTASAVMVLRYITCGIALVLIMNLQILAVYGYFAIPRIRKSSTVIAFVVASLLNVVSIYRLVVMRLQTTSLTSMAPGSLNSTQSKVTFYVFQALPELLVATILLNIDVRERFSTGFWSDLLVGMKKSREVPETDSKLKE